MEHRWGHTVHGVWHTSHSTGHTAQGTQHVAVAVCQAAGPAPLPPLSAPLRALDSGPRHSGASAHSGTSKRRLLGGSRHAAGHGHPECGGCGCPRLLSPGGAARCHREGTRQHPGAASLSAHPPLTPRRVGVSIQRAGGWAQGWCFIGGIMQPPNITVTEKRGPRGQQGWGGSGPQGTDHRERAVPGVSCTGGPGLSPCPSQVGAVAGLGLAGTPSVPMPHRESGRGGLTGAR